MEQQLTNHPNQKRSFWEINATVLKAVIIFIIGLLLLIPASMVQGLIGERQERQNEVISEVSSTWGGRQTISGPILSIPYIYYFTETESGQSKVKSAIGYMHFLPENLKISSVLYPEKRHRSIYDVVVYTADLNISGNFIPLQTNLLPIPAKDIQWSGAELCLGIPDLRGIKEQIFLEWDTLQNKIPFNPGIESEDVISGSVTDEMGNTIGGGVSSAIGSQLKEQLHKGGNFKFSVKLRGSERIYFTPTGKITEVSTKSAWQTPSFTGSFLPEKPAKIDASGFTANWKVLHLNRNYPQYWVDDKYHINESSFGVDLLMPLDTYQKSERSAKYAILMIAFTFITFFFMEMLNKKYLHPFQYILVGIALCLFYTLLLSISEYLGFNLAYGLAGIMTISLIMWYISSVLESKKLSALIGGTLFLLYSFIFVIIQLEDYALLVGSFGLFIALVVLMYYSRKIFIKNN